MSDKREEMSKQFIQAEFGHFINLTHFLAPLCCDEIVEQIIKSKGESWKAFELYWIIFQVYCPLEVFLETGLLYSVFVQR